MYKKEMQSKRGGRVKTPIQFVHLARAEEQRVGDFRDEGLACLGIYPYSITFTSTLKDTLV